MSPDDTVGTPEKSYVAGGDAFLYPGAGDQAPPRGAKVSLLTRGGVCTMGHWGDPFFIGWAPLPKRDKAKEALL